MIARQNYSSSDRYHQYFYSNGRINSPNGPDTWVLCGNSLTLRWPTSSAPGGAWVDQCILSQAGTAYTCKNQINDKINGKVIKGKIENQ
jgi:hypothetical protein